MTRPRCFFADRGAGPCDGRLVRAHLIPAQRVRREVSRDPQVVWSPDVWVWACGGLDRLSGHHGMFDARQIEVARADLPAAVERFAERHGLGWSLDRDYGMAA